MSEKQEETAEIKGKWEFWPGEPRNWKMGMLQGCLVCRRDWGQRRTCCLRGSEDFSGEYVEQSTCSEWYAVYFQLYWRIMSTVLPKEFPSGTGSIASSNTASFPLSSENAVLHCKTVYSEFFHNSTARSCPVGWKAYISYQPSPE